MTREVVWSLVAVVALAGCHDMTADRQPDAFVWKLESMAAPGGVFVLDSVGDYVAGEYCVNCLPPVFLTQWCNALGTGPGYQVRQRGVFTDVCADSTASDGQSLHQSDSVKGELRVGGQLIVAGWNWRGTSVGYVHASGCLNGHLLWTLADTSGRQLGPFVGSQLGVDDGAWRLVREAFTPQC